MSEPTIHDKVDAFADGELPPGEADEFRAHLAGCAQCQAELRDIMMLAAATQPLADAKSTAPAASAAGGATVIALASRRRRIVLAVAGACAAAAAIVIAVRAFRPTLIVLAQSDRRPLEARLSDAQADRWRPYEVMRGGAAREEVRVDTLAALERRGDWGRLGEA